MEKATGFIQETIIKNNPELAGATCQVDYNQTRIVDDVRHEIDIFVKTLVGSPYESAWIFECKDWKRPVGKAVIADFADKVAAVGANRGYIVARSLSKYAAARLAQDRRLGFVEWTDQFQSPLDGLEASHLMHDPLAHRITITWADLSRNNPTELLWEALSCHLNSQKISIEAFVNRHFEQMIRDDQQQNRKTYSHGGTHFCELHKTIEFTSDSFSVEEHQVARMELLANYFVTFRRTKASAKFELKRQGRVYSFSFPDETEPEHSIEIDVVSLNRP